MTIQVRQEPSKYFGHIYEHSEFGGIYQVQFKEKPQFIMTPEMREEMDLMLLNIEQFAPKVEE